MYNKLSQKERKVKKKEVTKVVVFDDPGGKSYGHLSGDPGLPKRMEKIIMLYWLR